MAWIPFWYQAAIRTHDKVAEGVLREGGWRQIKSGHVQIRQTKSDMSRLDNTKSGHVQMRLVF
jgi:hypothetical protein